MCIKRIVHFSITLGLAFLVVSCQYEAPLLAKKTNLRKTIKGEAQGTTYSIVYYSDSIELVKAEIDSILLEIDFSMSTWNSESIISKFNNGQDSVLLDRHFIRNLEMSHIYSRSTEGAFNPTVKPLLDYYGLGANNSNNIEIDSSEVSRILKCAKMDSINVLLGERTLDLNGLLLSSDKGSAIKLLQNACKQQLDFNAIAQGYSVDVLSQFCQYRGLKSFLIELGGEMYAKGKRPAGENWLIGIDKPTEDVGKRTLQAKLRVEDKAIATSGNYRKFTDIDGVKFHHTINPKTGYPAKNSLLSATVISDDCATADAFATAFMVMGFEQSVGFLSTEDGKTLDAFLIYSEKGEYKFFTTKGVEDRLEIDLQ